MLVKYSYYNTTLQTWLDVVIDMPVDIYNAPMYGKPQRSPKKDFAIISGIPDHSSFIISPLLIQR